MVKALILAAALSLPTMCSPTAPPPSDPRTIWCAHNEPRRDYHDGMSRAEVDNLNAHNERGVKWCGWSP